MGIWQTVWLEYVEKSRIEYAKYYPSAEQKNVQMEISVKGEEKLSVVCEYKGKTQGSVEISLKSGVNRIVVPLDEIYLWEAGCGRLYDVTLTYLKSRTRLSNFTFIFHFCAVEKEIATQSSILAWRILGTGEPGVLKSMGTQSRT